MTKLSFSLENKNPSPIKGEFSADTDQDHYNKRAASDEDGPSPDIKDPEFEINGLCIDDDEDTAAALASNNSEPLAEDHPSLEQRKIDDGGSSTKLPPLLWGLVSICGRRREMEDSVIAVPRFAGIPSYMLYDDADGGGEVDGNSPNHDFSSAAHLFGVYDGHGGSQVANLCRERLHQVLAEEIKESHAIRGGKNGNSKEARWRDIFAGCFQRMDDEVAGGLDSVGSTAVVAVVCGTHVIVGNCGDSRAVLCRGKQPLPLSVDHKPEREDECSRIEASGGRVINWDGYRVSGVLAVSRSIGKFDYFFFSFCIKNSRNFDAKVPTTIIHLKKGDRYLRPYVIPEPEVTFVARAKEDECLILASDGLWDVMTNKEACDLARRRLALWHKKNGDKSNNMMMSEEGGDDEMGSWDAASQDASEYLSKLALKRGSRDNISVIVVDLKLRRKKKKTINKDVNGYVGSLPSLLSYFSDKKASP